MSSAHGRSGEIFCVVLTENDKSDEQEGATDHQEAGRGPRETLLENPTGHPLYRRAGVRGVGVRGRDRREEEEMNMKWTMRYSLWAIEKKAAVEAWRINYELVSPSLPGVVGLGGQDKENN